MHIIMLMRSASVVQVLQDFLQVFWWMKLELTYRLADLLVARCMFYCSANSGFISKTVIPALVFAIRMC